jgi:hypothetical protein
VPQLVKATAKCPCGRRQIHLAVRQVCGSSKQFETCCSCGIAEHLDQLPSQENHQPVGLQQLTPLCQRT